MRAGSKEVNVSYNNLDMFMHLFDSDDPSFAEQTTYLYFRKLFYKNMPEVALPKATYSSSSDLAKILVEYMKQDYKSVSKKILMEAVWILTNFVCVSQGRCHAVVQAGGIKTLEKLIRNAEPSSELKLQCIRAIGNIAADCLCCSGRCSSPDILQMIGKALESKEFKTLKQKEILMRCTMNILRPGYNDIGNKITPPIMATCYHIILNYKNNYDIVSYAICCMAVLNTSEWLPYPNATLAEDSQIVDTIIQKFLDENNENEESSMSVLSRMADNVSSVLRSIIISHPNFYELIKKGLKSKNNKIREEAAWICRHTACSKYSEKLFHDDEVYAILLYETSRSACDSLLNFRCSLVLYYMITAENVYRVLWLIARGFCNVYPNLLGINISSHIFDLIELLLAILADCPHYIGLINKLQVVEKISTIVLNAEPALPPLKLQLQTMIESCLSKKKPYTFILVPRGCQE